MIVPVLIPNNSELTNRYDNFYFYSGKQFTLPYVAQHIVNTNLNPTTSALSASSHPRQTPSSSTSLRYPPSNPPLSPTTPSNATRASPTANSQNAAQSRRHYPPQTLAAEIEIPPATSYGVRGDP